jgi:hypothetical protein
MNADARVWFRIFLCVAFVASLYGGMILLTAAMFAKGLMSLAIVSGLVLSVMTAMALALISLAWSMTSDSRDQDLVDLAVQPG